MYRESLTHVLQRHKFHRHSTRVKDTRYISFLYQFYKKNYILRAMDETTRNIIEKITINYSEPQEIRPKKFTKTYYDCSQLSINDLNRLAASAFGETKPEFEIAVPVNVYSILFAGALAHGHAVSILESTGKIYGPSIKNRKIILVSDVVHEGHEFIRAKKIVEELDAEIVGFVCIVDRSSGQVQPLFSAFQTDLS